MTQTTAAAAHQLQIDRDMAWSRVAGSGDPAVLTGAERAMLRDAQRKFDALDVELSAVRDGLGGRVYRVPDSNLDALRKRVAKINRRAEKLGVTPVHFVETEETWEHERRGDVSREVIEVVPHTFVIVGSEVVKLAGWRFAATIEHDEEGNIIRQVPGVEADLSAYREVAPWCFHCKTVRRRIDTFVVLHDDGRTEQIGRNCLVDFLGADAKYAAQQAEWLADLEAALDDAEDADALTGARGVPTIALDEFLTHVALSIRTSRWVSRGAARDHGGDATADHAERNLRDCRKAGYKPPREREYHELPEEQDEQAAAAALAWARETYGAKPIDERDDFEHNMAVALAHDYLPVRRTGLAAYAIQAHRRAIEEDVRKAQVAESEFVGEVGDRIELAVTVARVVELTDRYSYGRDTKPLYLFVDADGNSIKWFASSWATTLTAGEAYTLKATVKRHENDPKYGKATIVTRCKVVATEEGS